MSLFDHPSSLRAALWILGLTSILLGYLIARARRSKVRPQVSIRRTPEAPAATDSLSGLSGSPGSSGSAARPPSTVATSSATWASVFDARPSLTARAMRVSLVLLALVVALGFILILLPESSVQQIAQALLATRAADIPPENVALLYLGDETNEKGFHIRGVIRNISSQPIEKLDASVRLYSNDGALLEPIGPIGICFNG